MCLLRLRVFWVARCWVRRFRRRRKPLDLVECVAVSDWKQNQPLVSLICHSEGLSSGLLLVTNGDILGCSGIMRSWLAFLPCYLQPNQNTAFNRQTHNWKLWFVASFAVTAQFLLWLTGTNYAMNPPSQSDAPVADSSSSIAYILSGLLVGWGTTLGNGCTSGHGICGLGRFSIRSLVAVLTFLVVGLGSATVLWSPSTPWASATSFLRTNHPSAAAEVRPVIGQAVTLLAVVLALIGQSASSSPPDPLPPPTKAYGAVVSGALFAIGLALSGMTKTSKVHGFLDLSPFLFSSVTSFYDPTLMTVLGSAVVISGLSYQYVYYLQRKTQPSVDNGAATTTTNCGPLWCEGRASWSSIPSSSIVDGSLILGAACFGVGWGLTGLCPAPALFAAASGILPVAVFFLPAFFVGSYLGTFRQTANMSTKGGGPCEKKLS